MSGLKTALLSFTGVAAVSAVAVYWGTSEPEEVVVDNAPTTYTQDEARALAAEFSEHLSAILEHRVERGFATQEQADALNAKADELVEAMPEALAQKLWDGQENTTFFFAYSRADNVYFTQLHDFTEALSPTLSTWVNDYNDSLFNGNCFLAERVSASEVECKDDQLTSYSIRRNVSDVTMTYDFEERMAFYQPAAGYGSRTSEDNFEAVPFSDLDADRLAEIFAFKANTDAAIQAAYEAYGQQFDDQFDTMIAEAETAGSRIALEAQQEQALPMNAPRQP